MSWRLTIARFHGATKHLNFLTHQAGCGRKSAFVLHHVTTFPFYFVPCKQTPFHQIVLITCGNLHIFVSARQQGMWDTSDDGDLLSPDLGWLSGRRGLVGIWKSAIWGPFNILPLWIPTCHSKDSDTTCLSGTSLLPRIKMFPQMTFATYQERDQVLGTFLPTAVPSSHSSQDFPSLPGPSAKKISQILYNLTSTP